MLSRNFFVRHRYMMSKMQAAPLTLQTDMLGSHMQCALTSEYAVMALASAFCGLKTSQRTQEAAICSRRVAGTLPLLSSSFSTDENRLSSNLKPAAFVTSLSERNDTSLEASESWQQASRLLKQIAFVRTAAPTFLSDRSPFALKEATEPRDCDTSLAAMNP